MTDFQRYRERTRDIQDMVERHVWGQQEHVSGSGSIMRVKGTGTEDIEVPVLNIGGNSFNLPQDSNAEVLILGGGSDTNLKFAVLTIPRDKQRPWAEGTGGVQHPTDPDRAVEFNGEELWLKDGTFVLGNNKELKVTISGGEVTLTTSKIVINSDVEINGDVLTHNGVNISSTHIHGGVEPGGGTTDAPVS